MKLGSSKGGRVSALIWGVIALAILIAVPLVVMTVDDDNKTSPNANDENDPFFETAVDNDGTIPIAAPAAVTYKVTYDSNGGMFAPTDNGSYESGQQVTVLDQGSMWAPDKKFIHWSTADNGPGMTYNAGETFDITQDTKLYAIWEDHFTKYKITYDANGGSDAPVNNTLYSHNQGVSITASTEMYYLGHKLIEWNTVLNGSGEGYTPGQELHITENTTLYAIWESTTAKYTVTYNPTGGNDAPVDLNKYVSYEQVIVLDQGSMWRDNHKFIKWNSQPDTSGTFYEVGDTFRITNDVTLYAVWDPDNESYYIEYNANGGSVAPVDNTPYAHNQPITIKEPGGMSLTGHRFMGWNTADDGSGIAYAANDVLNIKVNTTLHAMWADETIFYSVTYDANGGVGKQNDSNKYLTYEKVIVLNQGTMQRSGYEFMGWNNQPDGLGASYVAGDTFNITGNTTLYAVWENDPVPSIKHYYIKATADPGATISPEGEISVLRGGNKTFYFSAIEGYSISDVMIDGVSHPEYISQGYYTFSNVIMNHSIEIKNTRSLLTLNVEVLEGKGKVQYSVNGGAFKEYTEVVILNEGSSVVLKAIADKNNRFVRWSGDVSSTESEISIVDIDHSVYVGVSFETGSYGSGGLIDDGSLCWIIVLVAMGLLLLFFFLILFWKRRKEDEEEEETTL